MKTYTDAEMDALIAPQAAGAAPVAAASVAGPSAADMAPPGNVEAFFSGLYKSGLDTVQGVKQLATFAGGSPEQQAAVNQAIEEANQKYGPSLDTLPGKLGYVLGVVGQFLIPGAVAGQIASKVPALAAAAPRLISGMKAITTPQTITQGAQAGAAFEATRPTEVPPEAGPAEFVKGKVKQALIGGAGGGISTGVGKLISAYAKPLEGAAKAASQEIEATAQRSGIPRLLYGQIRDDPMVKIIHEGAKITPGAAGPLRKISQLHEDYINRAAAEVIGSQATRPTGIEIEKAATSAIASGYKPFAANVKELKPDWKIAGDLKKFIKGGAGRGPSMVLATPQGMSAARMVQRDVMAAKPMTDDRIIDLIQDLRNMKFDPKIDVSAKHEIKEVEKTLRDVMAAKPMTGDRIIDLIQDLRNMKFDPKIDVSAKHEIKEVEKTFLDWVERAALKKYGPDSQTWYAGLTEARGKLSNIHKIKEATDVTTGQFNPAKFVRKDVAGSPSRAAGTRTGPLGKVADLSRLAQMVRSPIGSSGTTERWMGSRIVNALALPLASAAAGAATGKLTGEEPAEMAAYGLGLTLGAHGIGKALASKRLASRAIAGYPRLNKFAERYLLPNVVGWGEAISQ